MSEIMEKVNTVTVNVDGRDVEMAEGAILLDAALAAGIHIPHICHDPRLVPTGACRLCLVEIDGERGFQTSCTRRVAAGMKVRTQTDAVRASRKNTLELLLSEHCVDCLTCDKDGDCLLQDYSYEYQADRNRFPNVAPKAGEPNYTSESAALDYDPSKCVRCQKCVRYCQEVQMAEAITMANRGGSIEVSTGGDVSVNDSACEMCGGCVNICPTSALYDKQAKGQGRAKDLKKVRTTCTYCGVGCQMDLNVNPKTNKIVRVTSEVGCIPNNGALCVKGKYAFDFVHSPERLTTPLIKENGQFRPASWEEALALVGKRMTEIRDQHGPDAIAFLSSSRCTNEENYLMQKLARVAGKTNNIDQCATTCHGPSVAGLGESLGSGAMTNAIDEIEDVHTLFLIGGNPTEAHPIIGLAMKKALKKGAKLIVADPRETWMAKRADIHIKHKPGTDNMLINAMMAHILEKQLQDPKFIEERCENYPAFLENLKGYTIEKAAEECGVPAHLIREAAEMYAQGDPSSIFYTLGITEHTCGTNNVKNLANLAMLTGHIGKRSSGINPMRGQNNVQGACDMGAMPKNLPAYQKVADPAAREKFEKAWGVQLPTNIGGCVTDFMEKAGEGKLKAFYCFGEDPVRSEPNTTKLIEDVSNIDFVVCQEIFLTETAKLADVVLPATCWAEKDGTFANTERRIQRVRKAVDAPGQCRPDWEIICEVSKAMGYPMSYSDPGAIYDEMAALSPNFAGINYDRIDKLGLQWPCPSKDHPGTPFLHQGRFTRGLGLFQAIPHTPPAEVPDAEYPMILSTGRTLFNYNIGNMTRKTAAIENKHPENFIEVHKDDAAAIGIKNGDMVKVETRRGSLVVKAHVARKVRPGALWMAFHHEESNTNLLTNDAFDTTTRTGEYKACAARISKP